MSKLVKYAFLGGIAGGLVGAAKSFQADEQTEVIAKKAMQTAGGAAAAGAFVGLVLDRRTKKKLAKKRAKFGAALTAGGIAEVAKAALPVIEHAFETAKPRVEKAAEVTRDRAHDAYETAKPRVEHAARVAAERAESAYETAKPRVEHAARTAADKARPMIETAAERAPFVQKVA